MNALKDNQIKAAMLLVSGMAGKEVASAINCTPETISHWKKNSEFEALLDQLRVELLEQGREQLRASVVEAVNTLRDIVANCESDEVRRKAALDILRMSGFDGDMQTSQVRYGLGIGKASASELLKEQKQALNIACFYKDFGL